MKKLIAITIGDIKGIGINILIREWKNNKINNFIILTNYKIFIKQNLISEKKLNILDNDSNIEKKYLNNKINILNFKTKNRHTNCFDSLELAYKLTKDKKIIGILTLPINKIEINKFIDKNFIDQTTFFSNLEKNKKTNMVFIYNKKFFIPLTIHIELKKVFLQFKQKKLIIDKIMSLIETLKIDFKIQNPKFVISGINPHCGEDGVISNDEKKYLIPIVEYLKKNNININGPFSGDGLINKSNLKKYDIFLFTYHDQALIPFKIISNFEGVNFTSGLDILRVSPTHGTARDIKNKKSASSKSIINSFKVLHKIYKNRKNLD